MAEVDYFSPDSSWASTIPTSMDEQSPITIQLIFCLEKILKMVTLKRQTIKGEKHMGAVDYFSLDYTLEKDIINLIFYAIDAMIIQLVFKGLTEVYKTTAPALVESIVSYDVIPFIMYLLAVIYRFTGGT